jgi:RND family efflux transporter MFP subunit
MDPLQRDTRQDPPAAEPEARPPGPRTEGQDHALWARFAEAATPEEFCRAWLAIQCRMVADVSAGVVVLGKGDNGHFAPVAFWPDSRRNLKHLAEVAERALAERHGLVVKVPAAGPGAGRERYGVAYPIQSEGRVHGVVALDIAARPESQMQAVMRQLQWGSAWLELLTRRQEAERDAGPRERLWTVLELVAVAVSHPGFYAAATAFVTDLATRLKCDRVSLGFVRRGQAQVRAMSHSSRFEKRANLVRAIEAAMDEALDQQTVTVYPEPAGSSPLITRAHAELAGQHGAGAICSVPLRGGDKFVGVLTLERSAERPFDAATVELCEALAEVGGPILEVQWREDRPFIKKAIEALRLHTERLVGPRHVALKLIAGGAVLLTLFFAVARGEYRVSAKTVMEAAIQRAAVAPFNGYIAEAKVRAGDLVRQGEVLCTLDDRELKLERLKWLSQHEQVARQYQQAMAKRDAAQVKILTSQLDQARAQLALLDDELSRTQVAAQFDGVVVTGDLSQSLGAPVERGQTLFEVAPLESYRVVVQVDERDIDDVRIGQRGRLVLTGFPTEPLPFTVAKLTPVSTAREGRNYFRVEAALDAPSERLRPGMEGVGKIGAGRRRLIWIWTHHAIDWLRLKLWSWLP